MGLSDSRRQSVTIDTALARVFRLKKGVMTTARLVNDRLSASGRRWSATMVTLTYRDAEGWQPDQISRYMEAMQAWSKRQGFKLPYVWVMELQKRGAPHYHVLLWIPSSIYLPRSDKRGWWPHGATNTVRVRNSVGYVAKYASKLESKECQFPAGARIHGIGGLTAWERRVVAWWKLPKDLRQGDEGSCRWSRATGGGWVNRDTGEHTECRWGLSAAVKGHVVLVEKRSGVKRGRPDYAALVETWRDGLWREDQTRRDRLAAWAAEGDRVAEVLFWDSVVGPNPVQLASLRRSRPVHPITEVPFVPLQP